MMIKTAIGVCPSCGFGIADSGQIRRVCPRCGTKITLKWVIGDLNKAVPCDDRCQYAIGNTCDCSCGGTNHGVGYIEMNSVPQWVRDRDDKRHADKATRRTAKERKARQSKAEKIDALVAAHPLLAWLSYFVAEQVRGIEVDYRTYDFIASINLAMDRGYLSDAQISAVERAINRIFDQHDREQKRAAEKKATIASGVKAPTGKVTVTGEIVSIKSTVSYYGYGEQTIWKMIVKSPDGWAVYVTVPNSLYLSLDHSQGPWNEQLLHQIVQLTATFTPSDNDPLFAFGKRPTGAKLLSTAK